MRLLGKRSAARTIYDLGYIRRAWYKFLDTLLICHFIPIL